ncbi:hypothetical protein [Enterococcus innesii]|uniref:hypothetical protein n=1 Tax=Enterococcus innesii TaxID=2839759 RepID=UPI002DBEAFC0|nr:hypothetical protein [Enterococcus innesii]MEB5953147.1 hypothetical protein [Enterococcus innesii]
MTVGELMKALECMPENALVLIDYNPELILNEVTKVYLTGFDEYNPVVGVETNRKG